MSNLTLFSPILRQTVGFDRFNDLFENLLSEKENRLDSYPPYNIEKLQSDTYQITLAIAGFKQSDITITAQEDRLIIAGCISDTNEDATKNFLHRGIASRAFEKTFRLADHIRVIDATLENGLLTVKLVREIPEEKKLRIIPINCLEGSKKSDLEANRNRN